jgi:hypothetical protein
MRSTRSRQAILGGVALCGALLAGTTASFHLEKGVEQRAWLRIQEPYTDLARGWFTRLDRERGAYLSSRAADRIFLTRRQVKLPLGDEILSDGGNCGCERRQSDARDAPAESSASRRVEDEFVAAPADGMPPPAIVVEPVPEPATIVLCVSGIGFLLIKSLLLRRREKRLRNVAARPLLRQQD